MQIVAPPIERHVQTSRGVRVALVVALAHGVTDMYASFVPPLLPRLMDELGLSITLAATLAVSYSIAGALPQPLFGYAADRFGRRSFAVLGPLVAGIFVASIGFASSFWPLVVLLALGGLGSAAFHPAGASYAVRVGEGRGGGARYSLFAFGGAAGFAIGPIAAVSIAQWRGTEGLWIAMLPAVVFAPVVYAALPSGRTEAAAASAPPPRPSQVLAHLRGPLGLMFGISATMAFVQRTYLTMEPIIVDAAGGSETLGAVALSVYLGAQAAGMVTGGLLADRVDRGSLLVHLCFWALPAHLLAIWIGPSGALGMMLTACAGFLGLATLPPIVVMAQELVPTAASASSAIVMGLAWATGSLGVLVTGALADRIGAYQAALLSMPVMLVALGLALHPALRVATGRRPNTG
ncbi:MAG TPA: MFS transporter [Longimicrobiales bacterium]|nr:MFS transporter [Longimicrobiales bacterium]